MKSTIAPSVSDLIRNHISDVYLKTAIRRGERTFTVNVGEVHKALKLANRVPQVCSALESKKLLHENHLRIVSKTGPPSGQSTTVSFTYEILASNTESSSALKPLMELRGVARELFQNLGGGEAFIQSEREKFAREHET